MVEQKLTFISGTIWFTLLHTQMIMALQSHYEGYSYHKCMFLLYSVKYK